MEQIVAIAIVGAITGLAGRAYYRSLAAGVFILFLKEMIKKTITKIALNRHKFKKYLGGTNMKKACRSLILLVFTTSLLCLNVVNSHAQTWTVIRIINDTGVNTAQAGVKSDSTGRFMIAYPQGSPGSSASDFRIYAVTSTDSASWSSPLTVRDVPGDNKFCHIALLSNDLSVVAWHRKRPVGSAYDIWLAREQTGGGSWVTEQITDDNNDDKRVRVGVLSNDDVVLTFPRHIPAGSAGDKDIAVATFNGSSWVIDEVTSNTKGDHRPVIAIDSNDRIHLAYAGYVGSGKGSPTQADWHLFYTNNISGDWSTRLDLTNLLSLPNKTDWPGIAIDSNDNVHIIVAAGDSTGGEDREVYHVTNETGFWASQLLSDHVDPCEWACIAIGKDDTIHAAYQVGRIFKQTGTVPTSLWYAKRPAGGSWQSPSEITDHWSDSEQPDIAVNDDGRVVVVYNAKICGTNQLIAATYLEQTSVSLPWWVYE